MVAMPVMATAGAMAVRVEEAPGEGAVTVWAVVAMVLAATVLEVAVAVVEEAAKVVVAAVGMAVIAVVRMEGVVVAMGGGTGCPTAA